MCYMLIDTFWRNDWPQTMPIPYALHNFPRIKPLPMLTSNNAHSYFQIHLYHAFDLKLVVLRHV